MAASTSLGVGAASPPRPGIPAGRTSGSHSITLSDAQPEQVYGAITFYLGAKEEVEKDIADRERVEDEFTKTHPAPPHLKEKLECARSNC